MLSSVIFLSTARCCAEGLIITPMHDWVLLFPEEDLLSSARSQCAVL